MPQCKVRCGTGSDRLQEAPRSDLACWQIESQGCNLKGVINLGCGILHAYDGLSNGM